MPFLSNISKRFSSRKGLFRLLTTALLVIGAFIATYWSHIKSNEDNFQEYKFQTLDSYFNIISKVLDNDILSLESKQQIPRPSRSPWRAGGAEVKVETSDSIWTIIERSKLPFGETREFDDYIIIFTDAGDTTGCCSKVKTSIDGLASNGLDTLIRSEQIGFGVSKAFPNDDPDYQIFAREFVYRPSLQPPIDISISIIGLVEADRYTASIRQLDSWVIGLLITFLLLCLFGLPYFKMVFIAEDERIFGRDVIFAGSTLVVGAPVLMAIFLSLTNYFDEYYHHIPEELGTISERIAERFEQENETAVDRLHGMDLQAYDQDYDGLPLRDPIDSDAVSECEKKKPLNELQFNALKKADIPLLENFKFITKIDSCGNCLYHINLIAHPSIDSVPKNLRRREYFKDLMAGENVWRTEEGVGYVMRTVVSIEDQSEEAVYILNDSRDRAHFKVGSSQLRSVHENILPIGYQFAVIDKSGKVWFHSQKGRSTLENLYEVSSHGNDLRAAVSARLSAWGGFNYRDRSKLFATHPIAHTDLSVVTIYDLGLLRIQSSEILSITGIAILIALVLFGLLAVMAIFNRDRQLGLYRNRDFLFEFLTPQRRLESQYIVLTVLFTVLVIVAIVISYVADFTPSMAFLSTFLCGIWTYWVVCTTLQIETSRKKSLGLRIRDIFILAIVLAVNYLLIQQGKDDKSGLVSLLSLQALCLVFLVRQRITAVGRLMEMMVDRLMTLYLPYRYWYTGFIFSWLLIATVVPTTIFFSKAKAINDVLWIKADQLHLTTAYLEKESTLRKSLPRDTANNALPESTFTAHYLSHQDRGMYLKSKFSTVKKRAALAHSSVPCDSLSFFRTLLWHIRPVFDESSRPYQGLVYQRSQNGEWITTETSDSMEFQLLDPSRNGHGIVSIYGGRDREPSDRSSVLPGDCTNAAINIVKWGVLLAILTILLYLLLFFIDRFFGFRFMHLGANDFDITSDKEYVKKFARLLREEEANSGLLLMGLPFTGKTDFAEDVIEEADYPSMVTLSLLRLDIVDPKADIIELFDTLKGDPHRRFKSKEDIDRVDVYIIEHLEHDLRSFESNRTKLRLISYLISRKKRIMLVSEVYPSQILAYYQDQKDASGKMTGSLEGDFNSWRNILSAFPQVLIGITDQTKRQVSDLFDAQTERSIRDRLTLELGHSHFLPTLAPIVSTKSIYKRHRASGLSEELDEQGMVMHTLNLSHGYYTDIWNSLPTRERYMLYDLARDGFMNIKNGNSLFSLIKKGLVVWKDRPMIFNRSFRNFIVSSVSLNEALRLEHKNRGEGSWATMRVILYLIILTIVAFIAVSEPGLIQDFETFIGALGGMGVIIPLVASMLSKGGMQKR